MNKKNKNIEPSPFHKQKGRKKKGDAVDKWGIDDLSGQVEKSFGEFGAIDTETNLWEGAESKMDLTNTMEDLTVNQKAAEFQANQYQQSQANILDALQSGGQFNAGNIQALSNQGAISAQQSSATIGQQESANNMAIAQQEAKNQQITGQSEMEAQKFQLQGEADARDLSLQQKQGELSFLAGSLGAEQANREADTASKSDRRLKKNITKIGESNRGFNIYSFEYKNLTDGEGLFQGVMSDEVPQEAVTRLDGYDRVNYSMLDVEFKQI